MVSRWELRVRELSVAEGGPLPWRPMQKVRMRSSISARAEAQMFSLRYPHVLERVDGCVFGDLRSWDSSAPPLEGVLGADSFSCAIITQGNLIQVAVFGDAQGNLRDGEFRIDPY